jgi:hypothetical protein
LEETLVIPRRFCGPTACGNGGYVCGVLASLIGGSAEVTLRSPPPLDRPIDIERHDEGVQLRIGTRLIAEGKRASVSLDVPKAPSFDEAVQASRSYPWRESHPYPRCFVCGPTRTAGDGLCIYPGAVEGRDIAAAPFIPDASCVDAQGRLRAEIAWASLDCPSWFGFNCFHPIDELVLLGRLSARIDSLPRLGDRCISVGWSLGRDGRKINCASALFSEQGVLLALGRATWIAVK